MMAVMSGKSKADMTPSNRDVRFNPKADIRRRTHAGIGPPVYEFTP
jgi:hypothetical protein